jgi:hypothetical protein
MAGKRKRKAAPVVEVEVPLENAPAPPLLPPVAANEDDPAAALRGGPRPACEPQPVLVDSPEAVINNALCRELVDPTPDSKQHSPDPNLTVLDEIAKGISHGTDINHVRDDAMRIASHQPEKINVVKALMRGVDINRLNRFAQVRDRAEHELAKAAMRGDLKSTEYLAFLRFSANEIKEIMGNMKVEEIMKNGGGDSEGMLDKMDHAKQAQEANADTQYKGTTPQGREIIRKQMYHIETKLRKAGMMKDQQPTESPETPKAATKPKKKKNGRARK